MKPSTNVDTAYHTARPAKADTQTTAQLSTHASPACSTDLQALTKEICTSNLASEYRLWAPITSLSDDGISKSKVFWPAWSPLYKLTNLQGHSFIYSKSSMVPT